MERELHLLCTSTHVHGPLASVGDQVEGSGKNEWKPRRVGSPKISSLLGEVREHIFPMHSQGGSWSSTTSGPSSPHPARREVSETADLLTLWHQKVRSWLFGDVIIPQVPGCYPWGHPGHQWVAAIAVPQEGERELESCLVPAEVLGQGRASSTWGAHTCALTSTPGHPTGVVPHS